jgi:succinyl-CoA synthetase beta subunit
MDVIEYRGKQVFADYGIPVPKGKLVRSPEELDTIDDLGAKVVIKAQVPIGGRGKAGGIKFASSLAEARARAKEILGMDIRGFKVNSVLVSEMVPIEKELYLSITLDRSKRRHLIIGSPEGGMEIESIPDDKLARVWVPQLVGLQEFHVRAVLEKFSLPKEQAKQLADILRKLFRLYVGEDATLAEINPLAMTPDGKLVAADAKLAIDEDAMYRQKEYEGIESERTALELRAQEKGIAFIQLDGSVGVIANGAGLTMATLDALKLHGGAGGVFLDLGGTDDPKKVREAFELLHEARPKSILINIFGGITKCDTVAIGVRDALGSLPHRIPTVARIRGTNEAEAKEILRGAGFEACDTLDEAAAAAVRLSK